MSELQDESPVTGSPVTESAVTAEERLRRWRLLLGGGDADAIGGALSIKDAAIDGALSALYDGGLAGGAGGAGGSGGGRRGSLGGSAPNVARWLGDIRTYFPSSVVRIMQQDALERLQLNQMLLQPELLSQLEPDVHLVANLIALKDIMPNETRETARIVVRKVLDELLRKLENPMRQAILGSLNRSVRNRRPRHSEIDWDRTIRANLKHYQPEFRTIIPESLTGYGRRRSSLYDIILCVDQSGSMAASVVYSSVFGAVLASLPAVTTRMVVFDTSVVDLTDQLQDPVDLLFGAQLGGGTDINRALEYCSSLITRPHETVLVLISDLFEGGSREEMIKRAGSLTAAGVQVIALLALSDSGAPGYDHDNAAALAAFGIPAFACTPDLFPDLMAATLSHQDIARWAAERDITTASPVA